MILHLLQDFLKNGHLSYLIFYKKIDDAYFINTYSALKKIFDFIKEDKNKNSEKLEKCAVGNTLNDTDMLEFSLINSSLEVVQNY